MAVIRDIWNTLSSYPRMSWVNLEAFWLFILPFLMLLWLVWRWNKQHPSIRLSTLSPFQSLGSSIFGYLKAAIPLLRILAICFIILALARPQSTYQEDEVSTYGIDIVIVNDVSSSMLAKDFKPNRLNAARDVASDFVKSRPTDRIGLVVFAGESFSKCPITTDHSVVLNQLAQMKNGLLEDGTAIGMGLATAVNRLKESEGDKVVILLTDGENNKGFIDPLTATDAALQFGVRVYTIGIGTTGQAYAPVGMYPNGKYAFDYVEVNIDEDLLKEMAQKTGGRYFRATDKESLESIYAEIDELEKAKIEVSSFVHKSEEFHLLACIAAFLLCLELLFNYLFLKSVP